MRQIDWDTKLSDEDVAWIRQAGIRFGPNGQPVEDAIRDNQGREYVGVEDVDDPVSRSALDPAAGAGVPFAQLSEEDQRAALAARATVPEDEGEDDDYDEWTKAELEAEANKRGLTVEGTGKNGNVLVSDLLTALRNDDREAAESDDDNG